MRQLLFLLGSLLLTGTALGQNSISPDSLVTVPPPPSYKIPAERIDSTALAADDMISIEEGIVPGALSSPDEYQLQFDTTMAQELFDLDGDDYYVPRVSEDLIKDRLACIQNEIPLNYHSRVKVFIDFYAVRRRDFTLRVMGRRNLYFPIFERILAETNMPDELKYLSIIESALIPTARSRVGAMGLWQFMPYTGKSMGLKQNAYIDERRDPEQATRAACRYLRQLYNMFDSWELAIAAYNCGPGNVRKAVRRSGYRKGFWEIYRYLPRETRSYLPQFVAMMYVLKHADEHLLIQNQPEYPIPSSTVYVSGLVDLGTLAKELHVCPEDLMALNPELKRGAVPPYAENYPLKIPNARYQYFLNHRKEILDLASQGNTYASLALSRSGTPDPRYDGQYYHIVRRGEEISGIASRNGVDLNKLKEWNSLTSNTIYPGQKLIVYTSPSGRPPQARSSSSSSGKVLYHRVRRGEVLGSIARRYGVYVSQLRSWNGLRGDRIYVGQRLRVVAPEGYASKSTVSSSASKIQPSSGNYYIVRKGDVLGSIASKHGISLSTIRAWNGLRGNTIYPGQKLVIRKTSSTSTEGTVAKSNSKSNASVHTVRSGDSLWTIARQYGTTVTALKQLNGLSSNKLRINQKLRLK